MNIKIIANVILFLGIGVALSGTRGCQESYDFAAQARVTGSVTQSPTPSPTVSATPDGTTVPISPTQSNTSTASPTATASETPSAVPGVVRSATSKGQLVQAPGSPANRTLPENWLGQGYAGESTVNGSVDSDGDGFTDALEIDSGSNANDPLSTPPMPVTLLSDRLQGIDDDVDGLSLTEEQALGTNPLSNDSDNDGFTDGAETLSGSDPLDASSFPADDDGDGLSSEYEAAYGTNPHSADTDLDGLRDDLEIALGSNPLEPDSDHDGILDGKEVELGSDPVRPEHG